MDISKKRKGYYITLVSCLVIGGFFSYFSVFVWIGQISGFPLRIVEFSIFALLTILFFGPVLVNEGLSGLWGVLFLAPAIYVNPFHIFNTSAVGVLVIGILFGFPLLIIGIWAFFYIVSGKLKKEEKEDERLEHEKRKREDCHAGLNF
jgi:hypothetical protein